MKAPTTEKSRTEDVLEKYRKRKARLEKSKTLIPIQSEKMKRKKAPNRKPKTPKTFKYYTDEEKKAVVTQALIKKLETPRISVERIARELNINARTLGDWLKRSEKYQQYLHEQKVMFDVRASQVLEDGVRRMGEKIKTANLPHATIAVGVLYDKVFGVSPVAEFNIGDNRKIEVYYPNFKPPEENPPEIEQVKEK